MVCDEIKVSSVFDPVRLDDSMTESESEDELAKSVRSTGMQLQIFTIKQ